jgi:hypothetical protein
MQLFFNWIGIFLVVGLFYAACGGVTVNGKHHGAGCSCAHGVVIE